MLRQRGCGTNWLCVLGVGLFGCAGQAQTEPAAVPQAPAKGGAVAPAEPTTPAPVPVEAPRAQPEAAAPTEAPPTPAPAPVTAATPASESPALTTLHRYYAELNGHKFEAVRYFAPSVKNYITMRQPSAGAIDHYIHTVFPKQFESYEFLLDEATLSPDGANALTYVERSRYYVVATHEFRENLAQVRVEFDADGKIVDFRHVRVLTREKIPELR